MTDKTREKTLEEQIAEGLYTRMNPASKFLSWDELDVGGKAREVWETEAKAILAIEVAGEPETYTDMGGNTHKLRDHSITLGELLEKAESGKLCERVDISEFADMAENAKRVYAKPLASGESR